MRRPACMTALSLLALLLFPKASIAVETAPRISDGEIIERLTRLEEGQKHLETSLVQPGKSSSAVGIMVKRGTKSVEHPTHSASGGH